ncbi:hypothetical protein BCCH1_20790 [Burkholderia contaminans]|uniref:Uncharacterized protein n=1 Tax=Burkholderia contaminans TaxID=488447 RepID=A0A250L4Z4_9BURK|nr:hypothetical protein BCCH1_20790 [Burkholderia contaminans]GLZ69578.1 hypothetical protein Bcon01_26230 [Burkholderia contaminans]
MPGRPDGRFFWSFIVARRIARRDFPVRRTSKTQQPGRAKIAGGKRNGLSGNGAADGLAENSGAGADGGLDQLSRGTTFGKVAGIRNICTSPEVNG